MAESLRLHLSPDNTETPPKKSEKAGSQVKKGKKSLAEILKKNEKEDAKKKKEASPGAFPLLSRVHSVRVVPPPMNVSNLIKQNSLI